MMLSQMFGCRALGYRKVLAGLRLHMPQTTNLHFGLPGKARLPHNDPLTPLELSLSPFPLISDPYHSMTFSLCQNSPFVPPMSPAANKTGVLAPSSTVFAPLPLVISVTTNPGQQLLTNTSPPSATCSLAIALVMPVTPLLLTA